MIQEESYLKVADNTGAKEIKTIRVLGGSKRKFGNIGDVVVASVRKAAPGGHGEEGRGRQGRYRPLRPAASAAPTAAMSASTTTPPSSFDDDKNPRGTRIFGPGCPRAARQGLHEDPVPGSRSAVRG